MTIDPFVQILEYTGIYVFALSGSLAAVRKNMDLYGSFIMALSTALGGGIIRDLILGRTPPLAFTDAGYALIPLAGTVTIFFLHRKIEAFQHPLRIMDAVGLGIFTVAGVAIALEYRVSWYGAVFLGVVTGTGGGMIRDLLSQEVPHVLRNEIYAVASLAGALLYGALVSSGVPVNAAAVVSAVVIAVIRIVSVYRNWNFPGSARSGK